ncbi:hypothetical protein B0H17DRAFT_1194919 [Mycena rosella]|uniref:DUF1772-domain-containing protein n=1 Tax=Mycena rosella TaxID=1033263 RepID=A0AAD7E0F9_MYCRO|nr:hypothetical protein B0H17DRAFT_1194919 [Mycena rosella]
MQAPTFAPGHLALVTSLVSSSYFNFANIGGAFFGVMPATARENTTLPVAERLKLWYFSYETHMASSGIISALALSASAYYTAERSLRNVLAAGAVAAYTSAAFTILFLLPVNADLINILRSTSSRQMEPKEEQRALDQLDKWRALHRFRLFLGTIPWLASTTALLLSDSIIRFISSA